LRSEAQYIYPIKREVDEPSVANASEDNRMNDAIHKNLAPSEADRGKYPIANKSTK